jgi:hypothetical protein
MGPTELDKAQAILQQVVADDQAAALELDLEAFRGDATALEDASTHLHEVGTVHSVSASTLAPSVPRISSAAPACDATCGAS